MILENKIRFIKRHRFPAKNCILAVNFFSLEKYYPGGFKAFFLSDVGKGITNGALVLFYGKDHERAEFIVKNYLHPFCMREGRDFLRGTMIWEYRGEVATGKLAYILGLETIVNGKFLEAFFDTEYLHKKKVLSRKGLDSCYHWKKWYRWHPVLRDIRFKRPKNMKFLPGVCEEWTDAVDDEVYGKQEEDRIPYLVGSQLGLAPRPKEYLSNYSGYVAVLGRSVFSGIVAGLSLYKMEKGLLKKRLYYFT